MNYNEKSNFVFDKTNGKCHLCGRKLSFYCFEIDHNIPKSLGGSNEVYNLFPACIYCNRSKGNKSSASVRRMNGITLNDIYGNDNTGIWIFLIFGGLFLYAAYKENQRRQELINYHNQMLINQIKQISVNLYKINITPTPVNINKPRVVNSKKKSFRFKRRARTVSIVPKLHGMPFIPKLS